MKECKYSFVYDRVLKNKDIEICDELDFYDGEYKIHKEKCIENGSLMLSNSELDINYCNNLQSDFLAQECKDRVNNLLGLKYKKRSFCIKISNDLVKRECLLNYNRK